jgi:hypothetical protein
MRTVLAVLLAAVPAFAQVTAPLYVLNHHGRLLLDNDVPVNGNVTIKFTIYLNPDVPVSGADTSFWEDEFTLDAHNGFYSVALGAEDAGSAPIAAEDLGDGSEPRYLGMEVGGQVLKPRQRIGGVPFAMRALSAAAVDCTDCIDADALTGNIPGSKLAAGSVGVDRLSAPTSCAAGQVLKRNAGNTAWECALDGGNSYTAGAGLSLNSGTGEFSIGANAITPAMIAPPSPCTAGQVLKRNSGNTAWECTADGGNTYTAGAGLALNTGTGEFSIANLGVLPGMIAGDAVTSAKILDGTILFGDIAAAAFGTSATTLSRGDHGHTALAAGLTIGGKAVCLADGTNCPAPAVGTVANVVTVQTRTQGTYTASNSGDGTIVTPLNITFTPKKAGNKVILEWVVSGEMHQDTVYLVSRDGVLLPNASNGNNNRWAGITAHEYDQNQESTPSNMVVKIVDLNSLATSTTYQLRVRSSDNNTYTFYLNRTVASAGQDSYEAGLSVGTATEIWQ